MELYFATRRSLRFATEAWGQRRDGSEFAGEMSWGVVETAAGPLLLAIGRDVSERRTSETRLRAIAAMSERALAGASLADLATEGIELMRTTLPVIAAEAQLADGVVLASYGPMREPSIKLPIGKGDELVIAHERELDDEEMSLVRAVANTLATALARRRGEERMRYEALHDPLTGLPNRTLLRDRLEHALARSERESCTTGVLFIDLDNFKQINDAYGHGTGDAVLVALAERLQTIVRAVDTVARLGGDEFVVVCESVDRELAVALGHRLHDTIRRPLAADGLQHSLSASIGIALGQTDPDALLAGADAAVYRAKAHGGGCVEFSQ
jgi:diguanylate cyclase (GGDEF)-like protein